MANVEDVAIASQHNDGERQDVNGKGYNADISMESSQRHIFSIIRDYDASIRKSWPFTLETVNLKLLPSLEINKGKWNCNDGLRDLRRFSEKPVDEEYMNDDGYDNLGIDDVQMNQAQEATALVTYEMDKQEKTDEVRSGHEWETNVMKENETMTSILKIHKCGGKKRRPKLRSMDDIIASQGRPTKRNNVSRIKVNYRNIGVQTMDLQNFSTPSLPEVIKDVLPIGQSTSHLALVPREELQLALVPMEEALQNNYLNTEYGHSGISMPSSAVPSNAGATLETPLLRTNPPLLDVGKRRKRGLASKDGFNGPPASQSAKVAKGDIGKRKKRGLASTDGFNGPTSQSAKVAKGLSSIKRLRSDKDNTF